MTRGSGTTSSNADASGGEPIFDVATPDVPPVDDACPDDAYMAADGNVCALYPINYDRDAGLLTLSVTAGQLFELTDPDVEVIFATDQPGYEGFFTVAHEMAAPNVFYMIIADDDFVEVSTDRTCGLGPGACEAECLPDAGSDVCRAFIDDFIPIVANAYVGSPMMLDTFGRRSSPTGDCCPEGPPCTASASTYTEYVVTGPAGTMHFIFEDGFAFLDTMGWEYALRPMVTGDAEFEFDLCSLPVPEG